MANRAARLQKEALVLHARGEEQKALSKAKRTKKSRKNKSVFYQEFLQKEAGRFELPASIRRSSVIEAMRENALFILTFAQCCERPNRRVHLNKWNPPRSRKGQRVLESLLRNVLAAAPLKNNVMDCINLKLEEQMVDHTVAWLEQLITDPETARLLPIPPSVLLSKLLEKVCNAPQDKPLDYALRYAQAELMGAPRELAIRYGSLAPAKWLPQEHEIIRNLLFDIRFIEKKRQMTPVAALQFIVNPFEGLTSNIGRVFQAHFGWPSLQFEGDDFDALTRQISRWKGIFEQIGLNFSFPDVPFPVVFKGSGEFGYMEIRRLRNETELLKEAEYMKHCVLTYAEYCASGTGSIWSMSDNGVRCGTLQLHNHEVLVQMSTRFNKPVASGRHRRFIAAWLKQWGLKRSIVL